MAVGSLFDEAWCACLAPPAASPPWPWRSSSEPLPPSPGGPGSALSLTTLFPWGGRRFKFDASGGVTRNTISMMDRLSVSDRPQLSFTQGAAKPMEKEVKLSTHSEVKKSIIYIHIYRVFDVFVLYMN